MNIQDKLDLAHWAVKAARKAGADDAAVNLGNWRSIDIEVREGKIDQLSESTQNSISLSIYAKNKYSSHSTNDLRKESLEPFISEAVAMTKYLSEDLFRKLPDPKYYDYRKDLDLNIYDKSIGNMTSKRRVEMAQEVESLAREKNGDIIACTSGYSDAVGESVKVHSNGFEGSVKNTSFSCGVSTTIKDPNGGRPEDWSWATTRHLKDMPTPKFLAEDCVRRNLTKLGQNKIDSGAYSMLVDNRSASRLVYYMLGPISGRALQQKNSFLDGKLGEKIGSDKFSLYDDPFIPAGLGSRLYDGEGMAAKKRDIIKNGVLKSFNIDNYYANKLGVEPTTSSLSNAKFDYGDKDLDQLIAMIDKGILVSSFVGGNSNDTTGDFSLGIVGSYIEGGKIIKPVNEMNISGNLLDLWNSLIEVGNDPYPYSSYQRPSMLFEDIQFSGL